MKHIWKMKSRDLYGEGLNLAGPQWDNPKSKCSQWKASDPIEEATHRRNTHRIFHSRANTRIHSFRSGSSPRANHFAGFVRGPFDCFSHFATAAATVRVVLTAACAV